ncbi:MAG: glycosyltransferase, partial [Armatimonadetes bacterium]|nr:glycosyltransferase [Armatimonadota bacterium]
QPNSTIAKRAGEHGIETFVLSMNGAFDIAAINRLRALIRKEQVAVVNTHSSKDSWCAGLAAKLTGNTKVVRTRHLSIPINPGFTSRLLYRIIPDAVVTTGEAIREHIIEKAEVPPDRVVSIPTGIDLKKFDPSRVDRWHFRKELGVVEGTPLIGTVGMLRRMKGLQYFILAAARIQSRLPETRFVIVGDTPGPSPVKDELIRLIRELGMCEKVTIVGYREDIPNAMAGMDVFVLASTRDEGLPQVITQALAMQKPVVATNVGGVREQIIHGKTGFLVERVNADELANAVLSILKDPSRSIEMGKNGRQLVSERFSMKSMLDATEALYARILSTTQTD